MFPRPWFNLRLIQTLILKEEEKARNHLPGDDNIIDVEQPVLERAKVIEVLGLKRADAVHVASAEAKTADVLLTCDDRFLRAAQRSKSKLAVKVANPVDWLEEQ